MYFLVPMGIRHELGNSSNGIDAIGNRESTFEVESTFEMDQPFTVGYPPWKLTASLHLKMDGWNTNLSFWNGLFSGGPLAVSFKECI